MVELNRDMALMYHYVKCRDDFKGSVPIEPIEFRNQIKWGKENFNISTPTEAKQNNNERNLIITFDDATKDQYENAFKILKEENAKGYFAIMSGPLVNREIPVFHLVHVVLSYFKDIEIWEGLKRVFHLPEHLNSLSVNYYHYEHDYYRRNIKYVLNFFLTEEESRFFLERKVLDVFKTKDNFIKTFYMSEQDILHMYNSGMEIGVHCNYHSPYNHEAEDFYNLEIKPCEEYLTNLLGEAPKWYTPAFGGGENFKNMTLNLTSILTSKGYMGGFSTISGTCKISNNEFWHNRIDCNHLIKESYEIVK